MIICDVNPTLFDQSQIVRSCKRLVCFERTVRKRHMTSNHHFNSGILLSAWYMVNTLHRPAIFFCFKRKYKVVGVRLQEQPESSLFNSYNIEVSRRALLLSLIYSTLTLIRTLYWWVLCKEVSSTIFKAFGMTQPGIEPRSPGPLASTLPTSTLSRFINATNKFIRCQHLIHC